MSYAAITEQMFHKEVRMFCIKCGKELPDKSLFCTYCGVKLEIGLADTQMVQQQIPLMHSAFSPSVNTANDTIDTVSQKLTKPSAKKDFSGGKYVCIGASVVSIVLIALFILMYITDIIQFTTVNMSYEGPGYDTPEKAVGAYIEAIKSMELPQLWSTYAIESYVKNFNFEKSIEKIYSDFSSPLLAPPSNDFSYSANIVRRLTAISRPMSMQTHLIFYDLMPYHYQIEFRDGYTVGSDLESDYNHLLDEFTGLSYDQFTRLLENYTYEKQQQLQIMEIKEIITSDGFARFSEKYALERYASYFTSYDYQDSIEEMCIQHGADEIMDIIIVLTINNDDYIMAPSVVRYGEKWRVLSDHGSISGLLGIPLSFYVISIDQLRDND